MCLATRARRRRTDTCCEAEHGHATVAPRGQLLKCRSGRATNCKSEPAVLPR